MKPTRLAHLATLTVLLATLAAATTASTASAESPLFLPGTLTHFTSTSGALAWETSATEPITCGSSTTTGEITGPKTVGNVMVTFFNCSTKEKGGCTLKGGGAGTGKFLMNTLDGELGSVKKTEATSGVGLFVLPTSGTTWVSFEGTCTSVSRQTVEGTVAAEVTPVDTLTLTGTLNFFGSKGKQRIKEISVLGTALKPKWLSQGLIESSLATIETITYEKDVEVM
jgi:hypothetical protein